MGDIEGSSNAAQSALQDIETMEPTLNGAETPGFLSKIFGSFSQTTEDDAPEQDGEEVLADPPPGMMNLHAAAG